MEQFIVKTVTQIVVLASWTGAIWLFIRPHFADKVLAALKDRAGDFRLWNNSLYADWRDDQVANEDLTNKTHVMVENLVREFEFHRDELKNHRHEVKAVLDNLTTMPAALDHLATAINGLIATMTRIDETTRIHGERLASLEARRSQQ